MTRQKFEINFRTSLGLRIIKSVGAMQGNFSELAYIFNRFNDSKAKWSFKVELKFFPGHLDMALEA